MLMVDRKGGDGMRRVLITGGSRGIGAAVARRFSANGDAVAFFYQTNEQAALTVARETGACPIRCDVGDPDAVRAGYAAAIEALGGAPEVLVNCAGVAYAGLLQDMTDEAWRRVIDVDLSGTFYLCRAALPAMIAAKEGRIVNVGSMWGKVGASCEVAYSAAKAGVRGFTLALAKEVGPSGITVNCVEPGLIDTDMNARLPATDKQALIDETPLSRIGTPDDVAAAVFFLASPEAAFITGQCLGVDGGIV